MHGGLRHREIKLLLVHAQLLGISDALEVVSQRFQDRIVHNVGGDETRWGSEVWVWLLQQRIEGLENFETVYGVRDLLPSLYINVSRRPRNAARVAATRASPNNC